VTTYVKATNPYQPGGPNAWFRDITVVRSTLPIPGADIAGARDRLELNNRIQREASKHKTAQIRSALERAGVSARSLSSITSGSGAEFVPPQWIVDEFASVARSAAPLRKLLRSVPLPPHGMEIVIPRFDTAAGPVAESAENAALADELDTPTDSTTTQVATIAGDSTVSLALYERGGDSFDKAWIQDAAEAYAASLEQQLVNGTGTNGQLLGLLNVPTASPGNGVPGAVQVTYTSTTPNPSAYIEAIGQTAAQVSDARKRPPTFALMRPGRYFWLASVTDPSGSPTERPGTALVAKDGDIGPVGPVSGLPVYLDGSIPNNLNGNEDTTLVVRGNDILLFESEPIFSAFDEGALAQDLSVVLAFHAYVAVVPNRYPSAIGSLTGTGCVVPTGW